MTKTTQSTHKKFRVKSASGKIFNPENAKNKRVKDCVQTSNVCTKDGCHGEIIIVDHAFHYGKEYNQDWPWLYSCTKCGSSVGMHPYTDIALGFLANKIERQARIKAKDVFKRLYEEKHMSRGKAYQWLSKAMHLTPEKTHFGLFNIDQCQEAERRSRSKLAHERMAVKL